LSTATSPTSNPEAFEHLALFYAGDAEFVDGTAQFVREGLASGEPVLVAVGTDGTALLRDELGPEAVTVRWVDITAIGRNPARIIPLWREFVSRHRGAAQVWGIGQPIWPERSPAELIESQRHENLLNLAFADAPGFKLLCPYDVKRLDPAVVQEAKRSHPHFLQAGAGHDSTHYRGLEAAATAFRSPLAEPPGGTAEMTLSSLSLSVVRDMIAEYAGQAGLGGAQTENMILAVTAAARAVVRNGTPPDLRVWSERKWLVCQVEGPVQIADPLAGREWPAEGRHDALDLWLANQLCDLVEVRPLTTGTVVRLHMAA
jgi:hypothetical protein